MEQPRQPAVSPTGQPSPDEVLRRKPKTLQIVLIVLTVLSVLCCGGVAIAGVIDGAKNQTPKPGTSPSPSATRSPSRSAIPPAPVSPTGAASPAVAGSSAAPVLPVPASSESGSLPALVPPAPATTTNSILGPPVAPTVPTSGATQRGVHPGAACSPPGALGRTTDGKLMRCRQSTTDSRDRWRPI